MEYRADMSSSVHLLLLMLSLGQRAFSGDAGISFQRRVLLRKGSVSFAKMLQRDTTGECSDLGLLGQGEVFNAASFTTLANEKMDGLAELQSQDQRQPLVSTRPHSARRGCQFSLNWPGPRRGFKRTACTGDGNESFFSRGSDRLDRLWAGGQLARRRSQESANPSVCGGLIRQQVSNLPAWVTCSPMIDHVQSFPR